MRIVVVEARDRVGGRVKGGLIAGRHVDLGGMWAGPAQTRLLAALDEFGLHKTPQRLAGKQIVDLAGKRWLADGEEMGFALGLEKEIGAMTDELNRMAATLPAQAPWNAPRATGWDAVSARASSPRASREGCGRSSLHSLPELLPGETGFG